MAVAVAVMAVARFERPPDRHHTVCEELEELKLEELTSRVNEEKQS